MKLKNSKISLSLSFQTPMKTYTLFILTAITLCSLSCEKKPETAASAPLPPVTKTEAPKKEESPQKEKTFTSCEELMVALSQSSNASTLKNFTGVNIRVEKITPEKITIELYTTNDISEDASVENMADHAVGWLEFFPASKKLQDITFDPEEPETLEYDESLLYQADLTKLCSSAKK
ncbi:MAG: hypothetical protein LBE92_10945 [Chryseobacterium sp.]|uniref:hypothetical protein n=1 Tax=Chryseobacterium sp. TaxID=1871047 RepID=UPI002831C0EC|nr:hypothetical protein [Chryseobacterium sp.]MDR2236631.1 hypothetical protein [Chryseobacterium sp.]